MLRWRLVSAAVILSVLVTLLVLDYRLTGGGAPGVWLLPIACLAFGLAAQEMLDLLRPVGPAPSAWAVHLGVQATALSTAAPVVFKIDPAQCPLGAFGWPLFAFVFAASGVIGAEMLRYRQPGGSTVQMALGVFSVAYIGLFGSFLVALRTIGGNERGMAALVSTILIVKMTDTGAYFTGRLFGRHPLAPRLSPKKTIEGAIGGVALAVASAGLFFEWLLPKWFVTDPAPVAAWRWIVLGLVVSLVGMAGDLAESLIKRDLGSKDASQRLPGMGGVLDVLDSLLLAAPVAYALWVVGLVRP